MWEHSTRDQGNFPVPGGTTMVIKKNGNVQCRVVLIQKPMHKESKRNQRELSWDFKKNNVQWTSETSGENNFGKVLLRSFYEKVVSREFPYKLA